MRTILKYLLIVSTLFVSITACKDDDAMPDADDPEVVKPTVSLSATGVNIVDGVLNVSVRKDSSIAVAYTAKAEGGISELTYSIDAVETEVAVNGEDELSGEVTIDLPFNEKTINLTVKVQNTLNETATASLSIVVTTKGVKHGDVRAVVVTGAGTKTDFNDGDYTFSGHRHMHLRSADFDNVTTAEPAQNTKGGWMDHLGGIYPIVTSDDFNSQATASGTTLELTGGPTHSGKWLKRQYSSEMQAMFPANIRLRNWNLYNNSIYRPTVYVSFYLKTFKDDTGKIFRMFMKRSAPENEKFDFWIASEEGSSAYHWRVEYGAGEDIAYCDETFDIDGKWQRMEFLFDFDADEYSVIIDGSLQTDVSRGYMGVTQGQLWEGSQPTYALLGNTLTPRLEDGHFVGWALPYVDFSLKRIELADSPDWSTKTKSVIQPVKTWADDNIEFIVNQGDFEDLTDKHIFYLNGLDATYVGPL